MPKLKTHQGTKKRIKITASGKLLRRHAGSNHFLAKKSGSRKRQYSKDTLVTKGNRNDVNRQLGRG
jgi:large subunit ribosomal protein L35